MPKVKSNTHMVSRVDHDENQARRVDGLPVEVFLKPGFAFEDGTTVKRFPDFKSYQKAVSKAKEIKE